MSMTPSPLVSPAHEAGQSSHDPSSVQVPPSSVQPGFEWIGSPGGGEVAPLEDDVIGYLIVGMEF